MKHFLQFFFHRILPWIVLVHAALFMGFWMTNSLFYASTNDYLTKMLGSRLDYISIVLIVAAFVFLWSAARIILSQLKKSHRLARLTGVLYGLFALIFIAFFYGSFWLLISESPVQLPRLGQMLNYFRIIIDPILLVILALTMSLWLRNKFSRQNQNGAPRTGVPLALIFIPLGLAALWLLAVSFPPGSVFQGNLPDKPKLIAHRGASMLAPENTLVAAQAAVFFNSYGLETDIHLSQDGQLFLMHDETLKRTTDVAVVFPGREKDRAELFTLEEIRKLNAGKWFIDQDPFGTLAANPLPASMLEAFGSQRVPTLAEELEIVSSSGQIFIFDLKQPPEGHPYAATFFDLCLKEIQQAGIDPQVWYLVDRPQLAVLLEAAPKMKPAAGMDYTSPPDAAELRTAGYQVVNVEYGLPASWIKQYQDAGLWVNIYTIDEPWQFSRLWRLGVNSITTSNVKTMADLQYPILGLSNSKYLLTWIFIGLLSLAIFFGLSLPPYLRPEARKG